MKIQVRAKIQGREYRGIVVGFTSTEQSAYAVIVSGSELVEARIKDCVVELVEARIKDCVVEHFDSDTRVTLAGGD